MIRLVTQFDHPSARPAAATPSCCGCSCCCSCVVTLASASIYSAISAQRILRDARRESPERVHWRSPWPGVVGFFALPLAVLAVWLGANLTDALVTGGLPLLVIVWLVLVGLAYSGAGAARPWARASAVVGIGIVAAFVEFFVWLTAVGETLE